MKDIMVMSKSRARPPLKRPTWIIALVCIVCVFLVSAYFYPPQSSTTCYLFSSPNCAGMFGRTPPSPVRELTDDETASAVVVKEILKTPPLQSKNPKIAFMFLTPGTLPFKELWENFFQVRLFICVLIFFWFIKFRYNFFRNELFFRGFTKIHMDVLVELHW